MVVEISWDMQLNFARLEFLTKNFFASGRRIARPHRFQFGPHYGVYSLAEIGEDELRTTTYDQRFRLIIVARTV
jgi:hypothetical protein